MTTLELRAKEQAIERQITELGQPADRDVGDRARERAAKASPSGSARRSAVSSAKHSEVITGPERWAVLIGQAGTGKGVVIDAAARAERELGRHAIGVAIAGATAERLGHDSPAFKATR